MHRRRVVETENRWQVYCERGCERIILYDVRCGVVVISLEHSRLFGGSHYSSPYAHIIYPHVLYLLSFHLS